jgi:integrase
LLLARIDVNGGGGFARYLSTIDPASEVPSVDLLAGYRPRLAPYIYSPTEIQALMAAARTLTPPLRAASYETVIGLMATTGLRLGEALELDRADVDLDDGTLHVRAGQSKQREVPLHPTTTEALREYTRLRDLHSAHTRAFFVATPGGRLTRAAFWGTFPKLLRHAGLEGAGERARPRAHEYADVFVMPTFGRNSAQIGLIAA